MGRGLYILSPYFYKFVSILFSTARQQGILRYGAQWAVIYIAASREIRFQYSLIMFDIK
jgi:hypothetical protein